MDAHTLERLDFDRVRALLASYAMTGLGRALAERVRPVARGELVQRWLQQVTEMQRLEEQRGRPPFGGITDVREIVKRCAPPLRVTVDEMARVGDALVGTHALAEYLANLPEDFPELRHLAGRIGDFRTIADRIRAVVDERGKVRDDASPKLARIRREVDEASARIRRTVDELLRDAGVRRLLQYPNHTFHNDRLVLPLRAECRGRLAGIVHRTSDSGATLYVEPAEAVELNNRISNLRSEEDEEIARLLWELAHEVYLNAEQILQTLEALAVLDLIIAKVRMARDFGLRCPALNDHGILAVRDARHPLLVDLFRQNYVVGEPAAEVVPIDYRLGDDFNMLIVTGPNTGGKTVSLKTVGLLCLMVQSGVPVPVAPGSNFGVFANVLIDVGDEQSMQQSLSTFSGHLKRLMDMLRRAGPRTLVLIDELGAGTDPDEGAAIGRAILDELHRLECRCVVTTHLGALKGYALTRARVENASVEFDLQTLRPTYHLRIGEPGSSNAIEIAQRLGMPRRLIVAARRNLSRKGRALHAALAETTGVKRRAEEARREAESARLVAHRAVEEAGAAKAQLERQQADFQTWVQRVVHLRPGDRVRVRDFDRDGRIVRVRLDQQRAEVDVGAFAVEVPLGDVLPPESPAPPPRAAPPIGRPVTLRGGDGGARGVRAAPQRPAGRPERPAAAPRPPAPRPSDGKPDRPVVSLSDEQASALQPGDSVYAKRFHRNGTVVRVKPAKRMAVLTVGALEVEVPFEGLAAVRESATPAAARPPARKRPDQTRPAAAETPLSGDVTGAGPGASAIAPTQAEFSAPQVAQVASVDTPPEAGATEAGGAPSSAEAGPP